MAGGCCYNGFEAAGVLSGPSMTSDQDPLSGPDRPDKSSEQEAETRIIGSNSGAQAPKFIGPYRLIQVLGQGGMGTVWKAEQTKPVHRYVAMKVIRGGLYHPDIVGRFEAERQALAMMNHNSIARALDAGTTPDGEPYFVMELVQGISLTKYCQKHKLSIRERLELFEPICRAIQHAHQKGIIHRDLKPSNILVCVPDGKPIPKVIDFGLAKALQHHPRLTDRTVFTQVGQFIGTMRYMSPEQAQADQLDVDVRADVYSLGVILYQLLVGSTPLDSETLTNASPGQLLEHIRNTDPPRPSDRIRSLDEESISGISVERQTEYINLKSVLRGDLDWIVMKAIEKDRTRRYQTAERFAEDINRFLKNEPVEARPPSSIYVMRKFARRHRGLVTAVAAVLVTLVVGIIVAGWFAVDANNARGLADTEARKAKAAEKLANENAGAKEVEAEKARIARNLAQEKEAEALATLARSKYQLANARWETNRSGEALNLLAQVPISGRRVEWNLARRQFRGSPLICWHSGGVTAVDVARDADRFVTASGSEVTVWDPDNGRRLVSWECADRVIDVELAPDGRLLATVCQDRLVQLWDAKSGELVRSLGSHKLLCRSVSFSHDGSKLVSGGSDGAIVWDVTDGVRIGEPAKPADVGVHGGTFLPGGDEILMHTNNSIVIWRLFDGKVVNVYRLGKDADIIGFGGSLAVSPDGRFAAFTSAGHNPAVANEVSLLEIESKRVIRRFIGHTLQIGAIAFSPDGQRLVTTGSDTSLRVWDVGTGREEQLLRGHLTFVDDVAFGPDGRWIVSGSGDGTARVWDASSNLVCTELKGHLGTVDCVRYSPDGRLLASGGGSYAEYDDNSIRVWDAESGALLKVLRGHRLGVKDLSFSGDSSKLASISLDQSVRVWDVLTGRILQTLEAHTAPGLCVSFTPDNRSIVSAGFDRIVRVWNIATGKESRQFGKHGGTIWDIQFSRDKKYLATGAHDGFVRLFNFEAGTLQKKIPTGDAAANCIEFSRNDSVLFFGCDGRSIQRWHLKEDRRQPPLTGHLREVSMVRLADDDRRLFSVSVDNTLRVWDLERGEELQSLRVHSDSVRDVCPRPGSTEVATAGHDGVVRIWQTSPAFEFRTLIGHVGWVRDVSFSSDGRRIYARGDGGVSNWDVETGARLDAVLDRNDVDPIRASSPDGRWQAVRARDLVLLVDRHYKHSEVAKRKPNFRRPDPVWHDRLATRYEHAELWFAAAVERAWHLTIEPDSIKAWTGLQAAVGMLEGSEEARGLPSIVATALALPQPPITPTFADEFTNSMWLRWSTGDSRPAATDLRVMEAVRTSPASPQRDVLTGLGYFRRREYIKAMNCLNGVDVPLEPYTHHVALLGVSAISHAMLGNLDEARIYHEQLKQLFKENPEYARDIKVFNWPFEVSKVIRRAE